MLQILINFIFFIVKAVSNIVFTPIISLLTSFFPDLTDLITGAETFLSQYVFDSMAFVKNAFINITGFSQHLFEIVASYILLKIALHIGMTTYRFILKMWEKFKP